MDRTAVVPPGAAREDWKIIRALSELVGQPLPYDDVLSLRDRMWDISPTLVRYDSVETPSLDITKVGLNLLSSASSSATASTTPFVKPIRDFYRTDPISRASVTMAACSKSFTHKNHESTNSIDELGTQQASFA
jgi:NADH dehydrogenase (ubiquinone) Fe-S protein 1